MFVNDDFKKSFDLHWTQLTKGGGKIQLTNSILRLWFSGASKDRYTDTQIDDYTTMSRAEHYWKPPVRMTVKARFSHKASDAKSNENTVGILKGTAGFGFWNRPFTMQGTWFTLPESIWFFYSAPPSNMALVPGIPGWGWKAQVVHTRNLRTISYSVPLAFAILYGRLTKNTDLAARLMQKFTGTSEVVINKDMTSWHEYRLEWRKNESIFWIDDELTLRVPFSPTQSLGFVAWLDNEYAVATPKGEIYFGKTNTGEQWLDIDFVKIEEINT